MVPFLLDDLMKTLGTITAANTHDKDIEVHFHIAPGTPNALIGDALRLQQVLLILRHVSRSAPGDALAEIDIGIAMVRCGGDADLLKQVMEEFIEQFSGEPEVIARQMAEKDWAAVEHKASITGRRAVSAPR
ncbi:MAG: hypothetical protein WCF85_17445 [Rhodospirillaceae bacterium]